MKVLIDFLRRYKSIEEGGAVELPSVVFLTGANGSGKTQFLKGIESGAFTCSIDGESVERPFLFDLEQPYPDDKANFQDSENIYRGIHAQADVLTRKHPEAIDDIRMGANREQYRSFRGNLDPANHQNQIEALQLVIDYMYEKASHKVTYSEVRDNLPPDLIWDDTYLSLFKEQISKTFLRYFKERHRLNLNNYLVKEGEKTGEILSTSDIVERLGIPPWEALNNAFESIGFHFRVTEPISVEDDFQLEFVNQLTGANFEPGALSSGELTISYLCTALFQLDRGSGAPNVLLLDEPDAHLHPGMIGQLMSVLVQVFSLRHEICLVVATHSPTTCALAPEGSVFLMDPKTRRPRPVNVDQALDALCVGVPRLSIRPEANRQVFVESNVDQEIYQKLWQVLRDDEATSQFDAIPVFLSSGTPFRSGNCDTAIDLATRIRNAGSTTAFAFVDRDDDATETEFVRKVGGSERYSIENYVFAPIAIVALLLHEGKSTADLELLDHNLAVYSLDRIAVDELQELTDRFCDQLRSNMRNLGERGLENQLSALSQDPVIALDVAGRSIEMPSWFFQARGHDLEKLMLSTYPALNKYAHGNAGALMIAVVDKFWQHNIDFVSKAFADSMRFFARD